MKMNATYCVISIVSMFLLMKPDAVNAESVVVLIKGVDDGVKVSKQQDYQEALMNAKLQAIERAGVEIKSITQVVNFQTKFDMVETKANAVLLPGFQVMDLGYQQDGTYQVVVSGEVQVGHAGEPPDVLFRQMEIERIKANDAGTVSEKRDHLIKARQLLERICKEHPTSQESLLIAKDRILTEVNREINRVDKQISAEAMRKGPQEAGVLNMDLGSGMKCELVWIPPGSFMMGSLDSQTGMLRESPQHRVTIGKGFWMSKYEITEEQWQHVMAGDADLANGPKNPVDNVSWDDCQRFILKLNALNTRLPDIGPFRLPTEAEWEYACRAGTTTRFNTGNSDSDLARAGWFFSNSGMAKHPVGQKAPNVLGLYDMHGNAWEWCQDWGGDYTSSPTTDPTGPSSGNFRIYRGGCWGFLPDQCRAATRMIGKQDESGLLIGFRVVAFASQ
jgi:formylglycine-generating enzyme required for sulfatase activity